jgi:3-hydroxy-D-aspartate aldolase
MTAYVSRRNFLVASGTGAAALCVSGNAGGYTGAEMRARAEDDSLVGISKWDLETPALCVDVDKLSRNLSTMQAKLAAMKVASRPHAKTHKCPTIARMQLASGSVGICTAKLGEAEVFAANGIEPILMTTSNVSPSKIRRAMALRTRNPQFVQAVDHPDNARDLDAAAKAAGVVADVVVDVAVGTPAHSTSRGSRPVSIRR